jgi:hypothetical protein
LPSWTWIKDKVLQMGAHVNSWCVTFIVYLWGRDSCMRYQHFYEYVCSLFCHFVNPIPKHLSIYVCVGKKYCSYVTLLTCCVLSLCLKKISIIWLRVSPLKSDKFGLFWHTCMKEEKKRIISPSVDSKSHFTSGKKKKKRKIVAKVIIQYLVFLWCHSI